MATAWGSTPAVLASFLGIVNFQFFFLPPFGTFPIRDPDNWMAFIAFLITAITAGQLSARAKRRAGRSRIREAGGRAPYYELQDSFERSSQAKALKQSERLKSAFLDAVTHDCARHLRQSKLRPQPCSRIFTQLSARNPASLGIEGRKEILGVINEESDRLDRFVEGLTKLARIEPEKCICAGNEPRSMKSSRSLSNVLSPVPAAIRSRSGLKTSYLQSR